MRFIHLFTKTTKIGFFFYLHLLSSYRVVAYDVVEETEKSEICRFLSQVLDLDQK